MASTIDELFCDAPPDLENAIYVSYLENVFLGRDEERYRAARSSLSGRLQAALADLEDHWKKIAEWKRKMLVRTVTGPAGTSPLHFPKSPYVAQNPESGRKNEAEAFGAQRFLVESRTVKAALRAPADIPS